MEEKKITKHYNINICTALDFVCKARNKDKIFPGQTGICIDYHNYAIMATDGDRLHLVEFVGGMKPEFKACFKWMEDYFKPETCSFEIKKVKEDYIITNEFEERFPICRNIIPGYENKTRDMFPYKNITKVQTPKRVIDKGYFVAQIIHYSEHILNADFVRDLLPNKVTKKNIIEWDIYTKEKRQNPITVFPVVFESHLMNDMIFKAVIMPRAK